MPFRAVFLDLATVGPDDLDLGVLEQSADVWDFHQTSSTDQVADRIHQADAVVSNKAIIDRGAISDAESLKLVCIAATGTNNVDLEAAREFGIAVTNVTGYATASVVQHVFALILALSTNLEAYRRAVQAGEWQRSDQFCLLDFPVRELAGKTLGVIGYGELGQGVAAAARCFGMEVLVGQRPGGEALADRVPLTELLSRVDVLSLHCPLAENTRNLIGTNELSLMRSEALLINTARGGIVEEQALADALREHRIGGAGIDVLSTEPPSDGNPLLDQDIPNLILTPHSAWASRESRQRLIEEVARNIHAYREGRPRNRVV